MKNLKKIFSIILAVTLTLLVVGCGGGKEKNEGDTITLKWFVPGDAQPDHALVMEEVNKLIEPKIGCKLDLQFIDLGSFAERMKMNMASQTEFDLMWVGYANDYKNVVENGGIIDISELLEKTPDLKGAIPEYFWDAAKYNGKIYAVPNVQIAAMSYGYNIKKDLVDKYGMDVSKIKEPGDIESVLETIKANEPDLYPLQPKFGPMLWAYDKYQLLACNFLAVQKDDPECKVVNLLDTPEFKEGINTIRDWFIKGYIRPDIASVTDDNLDLNQGKYGVMLNVLKPGLESSFYQSRGYEIEVAQVATPFYDGSGALTTMNAVSSTSKHPEEALKLLELINTDKEIYNLLCFGFEGEHYTKDEEGKATYVENSGWMPKADWKFGNQLNAMLLKGQDDDVWEQTAKMNNEAVKSALLGFTFVTEDVIREISNITSVIDEYNKAMEMGYDAPENYLDEYRQKLETAGIAKVQEELQSQIDEFLAASK